MQVWQTDTLGGFMYSDELSKVLRTVLQPLVRFRQFADIKEDKGLSSGDKLYWNVYSNVAQAASPSGIAENAPMPETNFTVRQEDLTVTEFGNSVPFTKKLDDLSKHDVTEVIHKVLKNDCRNTLDRAAHAQFNQAPISIVADGGNSATDVVFEVGAPTELNDTPLTTDHVKGIADGMKERNVTPYRDDDYFCLGRPTTFRGLKNELEDIYKYVDPGFQMIFHGEIGRYEGIRFIEHTNVASEQWAQGKSDAAFFFGSDTVAEGIVIPEEIRGKIPTDYGRARGVAWYYLGGFGICHTNPLDARVFKWASLEA